LTIVNNLKKAVFFLSLLSLLGSSGVTPFCASCGPKVMDCCKGDPSKAESFSQSPCCDFRMSVTVEPHPARMTSLDSRSFQDEATRALSLVDARPIAPVVFLERTASNEGALSDSSPPLFLLNASFLC
jgi:hypothetical protein